MIKELEKLLILIKEEKTALKIEILKKNEGSRN